MGRFRNTALLCAAALLAAACVYPPSAGAAGRGACPGCNIILISIDTLRPDRLGCYGYKRDVSPNIDALAARGLVFDDFNAHSYITPISMAAIFTSLYPHESGYVNFTSTIPARVKTLPATLRSYGYKTAAFSSSPEFSQTMDPAAKPAPHPVFSRGFDEYNISPDRRLARPGEISAWLETNKDSRFFLWLPVGDVHMPYGRTAAPETQARFNTLEYSGPLRSLNWAISLGRVYKGVFYPPFLKDLAAKPAPVALAKEDTDYVTDAYDAGIFAADQKIGAVLDKLKELGLDKKTLVVLHSVHAEDLGERGYYGHYDIYDTELRGALIFSGPGVKPGRAAAQVPGLDLAPTLLEFAGIPVFREARGKSRLRALTGRKEPAPGPMFSLRLPYWEQLLLQEVFSFDSKIYDIRNDFTLLIAKALKDGWDPSVVDVAVKHRGWKLIHRNSSGVLPSISWWGFISGQKIEADPEYQLFDLASDPLEKVNLFLKEERKAEELKKELSAFEAEMRASLSKDAVLKAAALQPYP